jgi:transcriptional regulator with XRE-family HTH domain
VDPRHQFARNLRALRQERGLSIEGLGEAAGLHFTQISRYERGVREPKVTAIVRLPHGLGVPPARLFDGMEP